MRGILELPKFGSLRSKPAAHNVTGIYVCLSITSRDKLQSFGMYGGGKGWTRAPWQSHVVPSSHRSLDQQSCDIRSIFTPAKALHPSTCNGVSVRQLCDLDMNVQCKYRRAKAHLARRMHSLACVIRVLRVLYTYKLISSKLCRNCAATEHNLGRSGSKDKPACVSPNNASNLQRTRSKTCKRGTLPVCASRRSLSSRCSSCSERKRSI